METNPSDNITSQEFANKEVPKTKSSSGWHLALIIIGGTIGFAVFTIAAKIGGSLGYVWTIASFVVGSFILGIMGAITSYVGARSRLSTYLLIEFAFGRSGAKIVNGLIALSLIGWYGVISNTLGQATQSLLLEAFGINIPIYIAVSIASSMMIWISVIGFTGIDRLALFLAPVMVLFMTFVAYISIRNGVHGDGLFSSNNFTFRTAVSAVIGTYIAGVIIQPDYSRFAVNTWQAVWSVFFALGIVFPVVLFLSAIPGMELGNSNIIQIMVALGVIIPAFFIFFFGAWSSNVLCLYSSSLSFATLFTAPISRIIIGLGIIGTVLAFLPAQSYIFKFLIFLSVTIPPIGAIYVIEAFLIRKFNLNLDHLAYEPKLNHCAFIAWIIATIIGYLSENDIITLVGIASLDSLIVSAIVYVIISWRRIYLS